MFKCFRFTWMPLAITCLGLCAIGFTKGLCAQDCVADYANHKANSLVVFTSNILGSFNDPFEFDGNYGDQVNPIREYVFEQVVSREALASNTPDLQIICQMKKDNPSTEEIEQYRQQSIAKAVQKDFQHGPTLHELIPPELIKQLTKKQQELEIDGFSKVDLTDLLNFLQRYRDQKIFSFLRHNPKDLLSLDKILRDKATREGRVFDLPILSSTESLRGKNSVELKIDLLHSLFTKDIISCVKSKEKLLHTVKKIDPLFLKKYLGENADNTDLAVFTTPAGQVFLYWLYQSMNLHLTCQNDAMISQINKVKKIFTNTLGNPTERARMFRDNLIASDASIVFIQESDTIVPQLLTGDGLFHSVGLQNAADGTLVLLRGDAWEPTYQVIAVDDYEEYERGRLNVILATKKDTGEKFLLASGHGNSTQSDDGRLQITKVVEKFHQLTERPENKDLQLVIGIDANTKSDEDVELLRNQLQSLGLIATRVGPTTIKRRMVTVQHSKAGRFAVDEEDYLIILKPETGGLYQMTNPTVGFKQTKPDLTIALPNINTPSDHYSVGTTLLPLQVKCNQQLNLVRSGE